VATTRQKHRANKQEGDAHALHREGNPRGGVQQLGRYNGAARCGVV
jgi:hypothetical protein